jgi:hypothetical protein
MGEKSGSENSLLSSPMRGNSTEFIGPSKPDCPTRSARDIRFDGFALSKMKLSLMSRSSGAKEGNTGGKEPRCVAPLGPTAASRMRCFSTRAAFLTAKPLTDMFVELSGVIVKKPVSSWGR